MTESYNTPQGCDETYLTILVEELGTTYDVQLERALFQNFTEVEERLRGNGQASTRLSEITGILGSEKVRMAGIEIVPIAS